MMMQIGPDPSRSSGPRVLQMDHKTIAKQVIERLKKSNRADEAAIVHGRPSEREAEFRRARIRWRRSQINERQGALDIDKETMVRNMFSNTSLLNILFGIIAIGEWFLLTRANF